MQKHFGEELLCTIDHLKDKLDIIVVLKGSTALICVIKIKGDCHYVATYPVHRSFTPHGMLTVPICFYACLLYWSYFPIFHFHSRILAPTYVLFDLYCK